MLAVAWKRPRALALLLTLLLLVGAVPLAAPQPLGTVSQYQLELRQGHAWLEQVHSGKNRNTSFIDGSNSATLKVKVYNTGDAIATNIPLFWWWDENETQMGCTKISSIPARSTSGPGVATVEPVISRNVMPATGNYTMRLLLNREPNGIAAWANNQSLRTDLRGQCMGNLPTLEGNTYENPGTLTGGTSNLRDWDARNNVAFLSFIKDVRMDLIVKDVKWCRGDATVGTDPLVECHDKQPPSSSIDPTDPEDPAFASTVMENANKKWYNVTRQHDDAARGQLTGTVTQRRDAPNATFFEVQVGINETSTFFGYPTDSTPDDGPYLPLDFGSSGVAGDPDGDGVPNHYCEYAPLPDDPRNWSRVTLRKDTCNGFTFKLNVTMRAEGASPAAAPIHLTNETVVTTTAREKWRSVTWHLINGSGNYTVTARINPVGTEGNVVESAIANNQMSKDIQVAYVDLRASIFAEDFKTTTADPYPYPKNQEFIIGGRVQFHNDGFSPPTMFNHSGDGTVDQGPRQVRWRIYVDNTTRVVSGIRPANDGDLGIGNNYSLAETPWIEWFNFSYSANPGATNYIPPGKHTLIAEIDFNNGTREHLEGNNRATLDIYIADQSVPVFLPFLGETKPRISRDLYGDSISWSHPKDLFRVSANVTDDDLEGLRVYANFTLDENQSVTRSYNMSPAVGTLTNYTVIIRDFNFSSPNGTKEEWTLRVNATDSFGNKVSSTAIPFELRRWPVQTAPGDYIVLGIPVNDADPNETYYPDRHTFTYRNASNDLHYRMYLRSNMTGVTDQENHTDNLGIRIFMPNGQVDYFNGSAAWLNETDCYLDGGIRGIGGNPTCTNVGYFYSIRLNEARGGAGWWNVTTEITDKGGDVRRINRSFFLQDQLPTIENFTLSHSELVPGPTSNLTIRANVTDDFDVNASYANFTRRSDNRTFSFPLTPVSSPTVGGIKVYVYNENLTTGRYGKLDHGGVFDVRIVAEDKKGNWGNSTPIQFLLNDTKAPELNDAGVVPTLQETGQDVTFYARVTDETNVTGFVTLRREGSSEDLFPPVNLTEDKATQNLTATLNVTQQGDYVWTIWAKDSRGLLSTTRSGVLSIRDNLGPRFEVRQPSFTSGGQLYGGARPTFSIVVYDADGVLNDTIGMSVGGVEVTPDSVVPAPDGINGYLVTYAVRDAFEHRAVVEVNLSAVDRSARALAGYRNFTFVVDAVAPTASVGDFSPKFAAEANPLTWNVSLSTRFALTATDDDGLPTRVDAIRYRVYAGGNNAATSVYTGPFTIADVPGVYIGPKVYEIQFWAEDSVGNVPGSPGRERYERVTVYVDDSPPSLDPFGVLPQGRYINATFLDDRSGVDRAVVWHSLNGGPYQPLALDFVNGVWQAVLPQGKRGDTYAYYLQAWDRVNNTDTFGNATQPYSSFAVGNHVPTLRITAPAEGSTISRQVDLTWEALDADNDPLVFTVYYRAPGKSTFVELAKLESPDARKYAIDTARFADGEYVFRVTASDGTFVALAETAVSILNRGSPFSVVTPPPGQVPPGESLLLKVEVTKAQAAVEARVFRNGQFVDAYAMNDEGRDGDEVPNDGIYSVRVSFDSAGDYSVTFFTRYQEGGELKESSLTGAAKFSVKMTPALVFSTYAWLIVALALAGVAAVGLAAWGAFLRGRWP